MGEAAVVLEENFNGEHEPEEHEILEYAEWLGIDIKVDQDLLWIARLSLRTPLPPPWKPCQSGDDGDIFYFNFETGESIWDHPCDPYFRKLYDRELAKKYGKPLPPLDEDELICMPPDAPALTDDAAIAALKAKQEGTKAPADTPAPKAKAGVPAKDSASGNQAGRGGDAATSKASPAGGAAAKAKSATLGSLLGSGGSTAASKAGSTLPSSTSAAVGKAGAGGGAGSGGNLVRDADLIRMAGPGGTSTATASASKATVTPGAKAGLTSIAPVGSSTTSSKPASPSPALGSAAESKLESEKKKLEEDLEKKLEELRNENKAKLSKHRRDIMEEFNLERDKTFSELLEKHEQQIREEKQRLQQMFRNKQPELQKAVEGELQGEVNLKRALDDKTRELEEATTQLGVVRSRSAEQTTEIWRLKAEKKEVEEEVTKLKKEVEEAQKSAGPPASEDKEKVEGLEASIKRLETQLEASKVDKLALEQQLKTKDETNSKLSAELQASKVEKASLEQDIRAKEGTNTSLSTELQDLKSRAQSTQSSLDKKLQESSALEREAKELREEVASLQAEVQKQENLCASEVKKKEELREEAAQLRAELKAKEDAGSGAAARAQEAWEARQALERKLQNCQHELDETSAQLKQERLEASKAATKTESLQTELAEFRRQAERNLEEACQKNSQEQSLQAQQLKFSEQEAERLRSQLLQLESTASALRQQHSDSEAASRDLLKSEKLCQDRFESAQSEVAALQQQLIANLRTPQKGTFTAAAPAMAPPHSPSPPPTLQVSTPNFTTSMMDALRGQTEETELCRQELREMEWELERQTAEARKGENLTETLRASLVRLERSDREAEESRRRDHKRLEEHCQEYASESASLKDALERRAKELRQLELSEQRAQRRLVGLRDEMDQEALQIQHVREEMVELDNCLTDTRSSLRGEQQARNQLEVQSRSTKREVQALRGELQQRVADIDSLDMDLRRSRDQAMESELALKKIQEELRQRDREVRTLRAQRDSQHHQLQQLQQQRQAQQQRELLQQQQQQQEEQQRAQAWWSEDPPLQRPTPYSPPSRSFTPATNVGGGPPSWIGGGGCAGGSVGGGHVGGGIGSGNGGGLGGGTGGELGGGVGSSVGVGQLPRSVGPFGVPSEPPEDGPGDDDVEFMLEARRQALRQEFAALEKLRGQLEVDTQQGDLSDEASKALQEVREEVSERLQSFDRAVLDFQTLQHVLSPSSTAPQSAADRAFVAGSSGDLLGSAGAGQRGASSCLPQSSQAARRPPPDLEAPPGPSQAGGSGECPPPDSDGDVCQTRMRPTAGGLTQEEVSLVTRWRNMLGRGDGKTTSPTSWSSRWRASSATGAGAGGEVRQAWRSPPAASGSMTPRSLFSTSEAKGALSWSLGGGFGGGARGAGMGAAATRPPLPLPSCSGLSPHAHHGDYRTAAGGRSSTASQSSSRYVPGTFSAASKVSRSRPFSAR